jgi:hypothetical protein
LISEAARDWIAAGSVRTVTSGIRANMKFHLLAVDTAFLLSKDVIIAAVE